MREGAFTCKMGNPCSAIGKKLQDLHTLHILSHMSSSLTFAAQCRIICFIRDHSIAAFKVEMVYYNTISVCVALLGGVYLFSTFQHHHMTHAEPEIKV